MLLVFVLVGCGGDLDTRLSAYIEALQDTQSVSSSTPSAPQLEPYPDRGSLRAALPEVRVGLLDFIGLDRRCGLGTLVAGRNSALGMVMPASQRLVYEQTLLLELRDCVAALKATAADPAAIAEVEALLRRKSVQMPRVFWNATVAGPEFEKMFSLSGPGQLDRASLDAVGESTREALDFLLRSYPNLGAHGRSLENSALETHLHNLALEGFGGRILETMAVLTTGMEQAAGLLETPVAPESCGTLMAVHDEYVQAWLRPLVTTLTEVAGSFLSRVNRLVALPQEEPAQSPVVDSIEAFQRYRRSFLERDVADGLWHRLELARQRHQQIWRSRLEACGASPVVD